MPFAGCSAISDVDHMGCHDGKDGWYQKVELLVVPDLFEYKECDADAKEYEGEV